jgi:hypothetical protein
MTGTEFDPGNTITTDTDRIVSLVLPDTAESIAAGSGWSDVTFGNFTALTSVSGAGIRDIGGYAFENCDALEMVSLPAATSIGEHAFYDCDALETVSLPAAKNIGRSAFENCDALETVSLPAATSIGVNAFYSCDALETVSLPVATSIGSSAFSKCDALETVSLPASPPDLRSDVFYDTNNRAGAGTTLYIRVPSGAVNAYTTGWNVSADTAAGGNMIVYGIDHKRIVITD